MYEPLKKWPIGYDFIAFPVLATGFAAIFIFLGFLDVSVTLAVAALPDWVHAPFYIITRPGNSDWIFYPSLIIAILAGTAAFLMGSNFFWQQRLRTIASVATFVFAGVGVPGIISTIIKRVAGRARPVIFEQYGALHFQPFNDWTFQSFPSGDTTTIFAMAAVMAVFLPRFKWWFLFGALMVALSRIMIGVHYPTDVFAGFLLGTYGAFAVRNFCAQRGWIFSKNIDGTYPADLNWPH